MEQNANNSVTPKPERIDPPAEAKYSTLLNNVGNALMIGAAPVVGLNVLDHLRGLKTPEAKLIKREKWGIAMAATSVVIGTVLGMAEGRRLQAYRDNMSDALADLRKRVNELEGNPKPGATL